MTDTDPVVSLDDVVVEYGRNRALNGVTAAFSRGAVGLLGPNGAGKSTMIKALLGFIVPLQGQMRVLTAVQFVSYCGELAGLPRADATQRAHEVLYYVGLGEARYRKVETYSTGMKQRIKLAQALVHDPDLLFL